jgi:hypothetical protein
VSELVERPAKRPTMTRDYVGERLREHSCVAPLALLIRRGYFDALGEPGVNDVGIYDDAVAIISHRGLWTFNANADPAKEADGTAVLQPGKYLYCLGTHNRTKAVDRQYEALVQASPVTIKRVGSDVVEVGFFGINIHKGYDTTTGSEGCITIVKDQWEEFIARAKDEMRTDNAKTIPVVLSVWKKAA